MRCRMHGVLNDTTGAIGRILQLWQTNGPVLYLCELMMEACKLPEGLQGHRCVANCG